MTLPPQLAAARDWLAAIDRRRLAWGLLALWLAGLLVTALQLERWQAGLAHTLVQLNADAQFRARAASREQVDPAWYRRKALALLGAMEQLQHGTAWALFMPGAWRPFDDLRQRLAARMEREFGDIVLETIRGELEQRAARLAGAPLTADGSLRRPVDCMAPQRPRAGESASALEEQPEFVALRDYLAALAPLDRALQAWQRLQQDGADGGEDDLRGLVRYTLGAELPGAAARSVALFGNAGLPDGERRWDPTPVVVREVVRCSLRKGAAALDARLLAQHPLLAMEQSLAEQADGLFEARRPLPFAAAMQRLRQVHVLLLQQDALLAQGGAAWMRAGTAGPGHAALLSTAAALPLLGPRAAQDMGAQTRWAIAQFGERFDALAGPEGAPGLVWDDARGYALAPERQAFIAALGRLLAEPALRLQDDGRPAPAIASFDAALALAEVRQRLRREVLPGVPAFARPSVARLVDSRLAVLAHDDAVLALRAALPASLAAPFDASRFQAQRRQLAQVQTLLLALGAPDLAHRLAAQPAAELGARLAAAQEQFKRLPLFAAGASDFRRWQGEPAPLLRALGLRDRAGLQPLLADQARRLDALSRQAQQYIAAADGGLAAAPAAQPWRQLAGELGRFHARQPTSSLVVAERYLAAVAPDLRGDNCADRLKTQKPPPYDDPVARRLFEVHNALLQRCLQLRTEGTRVAGR